MLYTKEEIQEILWNTFTTHAKEIKFLDHVGLEYWFEVVLEDDISLDVMNQLSEELHESDLFDVVNKGKDKLLVKYIGENEVLDLQEMRSLNESMQKKYIEFDDDMIKRNKKLYSFLPNNVANSNFVKAMYDLMLKNKKLTEKQWDEFKYILDNGKSKYNDKKLTTKN